ncbi:hypothetical protein GCM10009039_15820 [Halocalculus aciditolerans]|uniref:PGF-CTERM sorting domain-containing protein n=1 Tax=Halocalculus aciditolerans TaxID=1383812 RepID=A0A830F673_9EURY|nr:hypothetical protein GCM10009039_15820 [Halocalculus aciditolerans]
MLSALVVVALAVGATSGAAAGAATDADAPAVDADGHARANATNATVGYFNGYWYDDPVRVDQSDGLNESERERYVSVTMARVEHVRDANFERYVPVDVVSRSEYAANQSGGNATYNAWNDQVWQSLWIVGEDTNSSAALSAFYGSNVLGFYDSEADSIKLVTNDPDEVYFDNATLAHELVHALQDQRYNLSRAKYGGDTQDAQLATSGLVEGEARYVEDRYVEQCGETWTCPANPPSANGGTGGGDVNYGVQWVVYFPYADGPGYVASLRERGGWDAVDAAWERPPNDTTAIIHHVGSVPSNVSVSDEATGGWETFPRQGSDTVGEASIYSMFWYQSYTTDAGVVDTGSLYENQGPYDSFNYSSAPSAGWAGDSVVPYRNPTVGEDGYVWVTEWDSERDASQFASAYRDVLDAHDAEQVSARTWVVSGGDPFADAYRLHVDGTRVVVVNGPDVDAVDAIRPGLASEEANATTMSRTTRASSPGFGVLAGLAAALGVLSLLRRRR